MFGRTHRLDVASPGEAIRALSANYPEFAQELIASSERGVGYRCVVDGDEIPIEGLKWPMSREFRITPVINGAGKIGKILLGVAMIAGAFMFAPAGIAGAAAGTTGMGASIGFLGLTYGNIALFGAALVLGGVASMLTPSPKTSTADRTENAYFNGPVNSTMQGAPVPIGYGRAIVGSAVISAGITVEQQGGGVAAVGGFHTAWIP